MNTNTSGALRIFAFILSSGSVIYAAINHKCVRCCKKNKDVSAPKEEVPITKLAPIRIPREEEE
jgi:hypothetical protein